MCIKSWYDFSNIFLNPFRSPKFNIPSFKSRWLSCWYPGTSFVWRHLRTCGGTSSRWCGNSPRFLRAWVSGRGSSGKRSPSKPLKVEALHTSLRNPAWLCSSYSLSHAAPCCPPRALPVLNSQWSWCGGSWRRGVGSLSSTLSQTIAVGSYLPFSSVVLSSGFVHSKIS